MQANLSAELQRRAFAGETESLDIDAVLVQCHLDGTVVVRRVVEQLQLELLDVRLHEQVIDVRQFAHASDGAVGHRGGERRQRRLKEADVWIERRIGHAQRDFGVHLGGERHASRARYRQARRRRFHFHRQHFAAHGEPAADLTDPLVAGE